MRVGEADGKRQRVGSRRDRVLRITAAVDQRADAIADAPRCGVVAKGNDLTGHFEAWHVAVRVSRAAATLSAVMSIDARDADADQHFASARYGDRTIPMDDALVHVALDIGGRPWYEGPLPSGLYDHWMRSFADNARATLHVRVIRGRDRHHIVEAAFKALGLALRDALVETGAVFSTKGSVALRAEGDTDC